MKIWHPDLDCEVEVTRRAYETAWSKQGWVPAGRDPEPEQQVVVDPWWSTLGEEE